MQVAVIDYGSGNLRSAEKSLQRVAAELPRPCEVIVTDDPDRVRNTDYLVLPGVGAFADCAQGLRAVEGMWQAVEEHAIQRGRPFLGICVGMQLMAEEGLEHGRHAGFGWIAGQVCAIAKTDPDLRIPHMGWNTLSLSVRDHPLFKDIETGEDGLHAYFVHSYHFVPENKRVILAQTYYGSALTAVVQKDNLLGTQFHPEKSQCLGLGLLSNFLQWKP